MRFGVDTPSREEFTLDRPMVPVVRRLLADTWHALPRPELVPVATATAEPLAETAPQQPAGPCWLPLATQADTRHGSPRHSLATLRQAWPHIPGPAQLSTVDQYEDERALPAPRDGGPGPPPRRIGGATPPRAARARSRRVTAG